MLGPVRELSADEMWTAFDAVDPLAPLVAELTERTTGRPEALRPWPSSGEDRVVVDDSCVLPAASLRMFHAASLAALAARQLLAPGGATVALLGVTPVSQPQLAAIIRLVPDISHVAICLTGDIRFNPLEPKLVDQLELNGIGLSVGSDPVAAVFGANLVIVLGRVGGDLRTGQLAPGVVVVNATGAELPGQLVDEIDEVFVDDRRLVGERRVRSMCGRSLERGGPSADLGQLLYGSHPGRVAFDARLLVELLGAGTLNVRLARQLCRVARQRGMGRGL